jgi:hypothetical protein
MPASLTIDISWTSPWYETGPVFVGFEDADYIKAAIEDDPNLVRLSVDIEGLDLVADLASLVDKGAYVEEGVLWWKLGREPALLLPFLDEDGAIEIEHLLDPTSDACKAAIAATRTAACLSSIDPERITIMDNEPSPLGP